MGSLRCALAVIAIGVGLLASCGGTISTAPPPALAAHDPLAQLKAETWWRRLPLSREMEIPADGARVIWTSIRPFPVLVEQEQRAIERLGARSWSRLEDEDVRTLLGHTLPAEVGPGIWVLLRGVVPTADADIEPDRFLIDWKAGTVLVKSLVARTADRPLRRTAVVAVLPEEPADVYMDACTAIHGLSGGRVAVGPPCPRGRDCLDSSPARAAGRPARADPGPSRDGARHRHPALGYLPSGTGTSSRPHATHEETPWP